MNWKQKTALTPALSQLVPHREREKDAQAMSVDVLANAQLLRVLCFLL